MEKNHMKEYAKQTWKHKREEILRRDNYKCRVCGATREDGVKLDVHHRCYFKNTKPYDYPDSMLYTLCARCHMEEHGLIMPRSGWEYVYWEDTEEYGSEQCELCERDLRYVHTLHHPKWGYIRVGCNCADSLTQDKIASKKEKELHKLLRRLKTFVDSPKWKRRKNGYIYCNEIQIWQNGLEEFVLVFNSYKIYGFKTLNEAKCRAFELYHKFSLKEERVPNKNKALMLPDNKFERMDAMKFICFECINTHKKIIRPAYVSPVRTIDAKELNCSNVYLKLLDDELDYDLSVYVVGNDKKNYKFYVKLIFDDHMPNEQFARIKECKVNYITIDCSFYMKYDSITIDDIYNELFGEESHQKYKWLSSPIYDNYFQQKA